MATPSDLGLKGKEFVVDKWAEFRAQSGFFQLKVALVGFNVLALVLTYLVFWPPARDFRVQVKQAEVIFSTKVVVEVTNLQDDTVRDLQVRIAGVETGDDQVDTWTYKVRELPPQKTERIEQKLFVNKAGRVPPTKLDVLEVKLLLDGDVQMVHRPHGPS